MKRCARAIGVLVFSMVILSVTMSPAHATVMGNLLTGSSGTVTTTINSLTFNNDSAAIGGTNFTCPAGGACNNDVASNTALVFSGCSSGNLGSPGCLTLQEGIIVNPISAAAINPAVAFMTFANHSLLDFSLTGITIYGPGTPNPGVTSNCASISVGQTCVIYPGAAVLLSEKSTSSTTASVDVQGKASDTGLAGLATGSAYDGGWSVTLTSALPSGFGVPTPANIQLYFCGTNNVTSAAQCDGTKSLTTSNSGSFTVTAVPEPEPVALTMIGSFLIGLGTWRRRRRIRG